MVRGQQDREIDDSVDLVLTLGGDGLMMHSSTLFREAVPPHLCFNLGSMGFLTPFELDSLREDVSCIRRILEQHTTQGSIEF